MLRLLACIISDGTLRPEHWDCLIHGLVGASLEVPPTSTKTDLNARPANASSEPDNKVPPAGTGESLEIPPSHNQANESPPGSTSNRAGLGAADSLGAADITPPVVATIAPAKADFPSNTAGADEVQSSSSSTDPSVSGNAEGLAPAGFATQAGLNSIETALVGLSTHGQENQSYANATGGAGKGRPDPLPEVVAGSAGSTLQEPQGSAKDSEAGMTSYLALSLGCIAILMFCVATAIVLLICRDVSMRRLRKSNGELPSACDAFASNERGRPVLLTLRQKYRGFHDGMARKRAEFESEDRSAESENALESATKRSGDRIDSQEFEDAAAIRVGRESVSESGQGCPVASEGEVATSRYIEAGDKKARRHQREGARGDLREPPPSLIAEIAPETSEGCG